MARALKIIDLKRSFGRRAALAGLSLEIPEKAVAAFVGANGAGKTTTFSIVGRFLRRHGGRIEIMGQPLQRYFRDGGLIGLLPQDMHFYEDRSLFRQLVLFAELAGSSRRAARQEVERVLALTGLEERGNDKPGALSHGLRMRLGIAQALIGSPPLVLLDEPTAGLDPLMQRSFKGMIDELRGKTTVVISSHNLAELESICDYLCIIDKGRLVQQGPLRELLGKTSAVTYEVGPGEGAARVMTALAGQFESNLQGNKLTVRFDPQRVSVGDVNAQVMALLLAEKVPVLSMTSERSLEDAYFEQVGDSRPDKSDK